MEFILKNYPLFIWNSNLTGCLVFLFAKSGSPNWSDQPTPWTLGRWHSVQINLVGKDGGLFCTCKFYGSEQGLWWGTMDHAVWPRADCVTSLCPSCHSWKTEILIYVWSTSTDFTEASFAECLLKCCKEYWDFYFLRPWVIMPLRAPDTRSLRIFLDKVEEGITDYSFGRRLYHNLAWHSKLLVPSLF